MAYAAATSLYHTIDLLLMSSRTSIAFSRLLKIARWGAKRLQDELLKYDETKTSSEGLMAVEARIRDEARRLEDLIESETSAQFHSQSQSHGRFSLNLDHLKHDVDCFLGEVEKMREEYSKELHKAQEAAAAAVAVSSSTSQSGGGNDDPNDDMVGLSEAFCFIRDDIIGLVDSGGLGKYAITGMAGIGKTTITKKLFHDSLIREEFECRAFVRVGQKYEFHYILRDIIAQLLNVDSDKIVMEGNETNNFLKSLRGRKYLIVLDDVWDCVFEDQLETTLKGHGVDIAGLILQTSRIEFDRVRYVVRFLNEEEN